MCPMTETAPLPPNHKCNNVTFCYFMYSTKTFPLMHVVGHIYIEKFDNNNALQMYMFFTHRPIYR